MNIREFIVYLIILCVLTNPIVSYSARLDQANESLLCRRSFLLDSLPKTRQSFSYSTIYPEAQNQNVYNLLYGQDKLCPNLLLSAPGQLQAIEVSDSDLPISYPDPLETDISTEQMQAQEIDPGDIFFSSGLPADLPKPGYIWGGRLLIKEKITKTGAMVQLYLAVDQQTNHHIIIKFPRLSRNEKVNEHTINALNTQIAQARNNRADSALEYIVDGTIPVAFNGGDLYIPYLVQAYDPDNWVLFETPTDYPIEGTVWGGRLRIQTRIPQGAMSEVFICEDIIDNTKLIIKLPQDTFQQQQEIQNRITLLQQTNANPRQIQQLQAHVSGLHHHLKECIKALNQDIHFLKDKLSVVFQNGKYPDYTKTYYTKFYASGSIRIGINGNTNIVPFLVQSYADGETFKDTGPQTKAALIKYITQIIQIAKAYSFFNIITGSYYGDGKPDNIKIQNNGGPTMLDFGLAEKMNDLPEKFTPRGTPLYGAPEQFWRLRGGRVDSRADLYALGITMYRRLAGRYPFKIYPHNPRKPMESNILHMQDKGFDAPRQIRPSNGFSEIDEEIMKDLVSIIMQCIQRDPGKRYQSFGELIRALSQWLIIQEAHEIIYDDGSEPEEQIQAMQILKLMGASGGIKLIDIIQDPFLEDDNLKQQARKLLEQNTDAEDRAQLEEFIENNIPELNTVPFISQLINGLIESGLSSAIPSAIDELIECYSEFDDIDARDWSLAYLVRISQDSTQHGFALLLDRILAKIIAEQKNQEQLKVTAYKKLLIEIFKIQSPENVNHMILELIGYFYDLDDRIIASGTGIPPHKRGKILERQRIKQQKIRLIKEIFTSPNIPKSIKQAIAVKLIQIANNNYTEITEARPESIKDFAPGFVRGVILTKDIELSSDTVATAAEVFLEALIQYLPADDIFWRVPGIARNALLEACADYFPTEIMSKLNPQMREDIAGLLGINPENISLSNLPQNTRVEALVEFLKDQNKIIWCTQDQARDGLVAISKRYPKILKGIGKNHVQTILALYTRGVLRGKHNLEEIIGAIGISAVDQLVKALDEKEFSDISLSLIKYIMKISSESDQLIILEKLMPLIQDTSKDTAMRVNLIDIVYFNICVASDGKNIKNASAFGPLLLGIASIWANRKPNSDSAVITRITVLGARIGRILSANRDKIYDVFIPILADQNKSLAQVRRDCLILRSIMNKIPRQKTKQPEFFIVGDITKVKLAQILRSSKDPIVCRNAAYALSRMPDENIYVYGKYRSSRQTALNYIYSHDTGFEYITPCLIMLCRDNEPDIYGPAQERLLEIAGENPDYAIAVLVDSLTDTQAAPRTAGVLLSLGLPALTALIQKNFDVDYANKYKAILIEKLHEAIALTPADAIDPGSIGGEEQAQEQVEEPVEELVVEQPEQQTEPSGPIYRTREQEYIFEYCKTGDTQIWKNIIENIDNLSPDFLEDAIVEIFNTQNQLYVDRAFEILKDIYIKQGNDTQAVVIFLVKRFRDSRTKQTARRNIAYIILTKLPSASVFVYGAVRNPHQMAMQYLDNLCRPLIDFNADELVAMGYTIVPWLIIVIGEKDNAREVCNILATIGRPALVSLLKAVSNRKASSMTHYARANAMRILNIVGLQMLNEDEELLSRGSDAFTKQECEAFRQDVARLGLGAVQWLFDIVCKEQNPAHLEHAMDILIQLAANNPNVRKALSRTITSKNSIPAARAVYILIYAGSAIEQQTAKEQIARIFVNSPVDLIQQRLSALHKTIPISHTQPHRYITDILAQIERNRQKQPQPVEEPADKHTLSPNNPLTPSVNPQTNNPKQISSGTAVIDKTIVQQVKQTTAVAKSV